MGDIENVRRFPGDETSIKESGMAAELPLENYTLDDLLDMLRAAGEVVHNSSKRWAQIRNAVQNKLERTNEEYSKVLAYHSERMNGPEDMPDVNDYSHDSRPMLRTEPRYL